MSKSNILAQKRTFTKLRHLRVIHFRSNSPIYFDLGPKIGFFAFFAFFAFFCLFLSFFLLFFFSFSFSNQLKSLSQQLIHFYSFYTLLPSRVLLNKVLYILKNSHIYRGICTILAFIDFTSHQSLYRAISPIKAIGSLYVRLLKRPLGLLVPSRVLIFVDRILPREKKKSNTKTNLLNRPRRVPD